MTAIAGVAGPRPCESLECVCRESLEAQSLYGRRAPSIIAVEGAAVGAAIFETTSEDANDRQPLARANSVLVADIRIDNRDELLTALADPLLARGAADSDILLSSWLRWGRGLFDRLTGSYAFAIFDRAAGTMILARSPAGDRPLCYRIEGDSLQFASMPSGVVDRSRFSPNLLGIARSIIHGDIALDETNFADAAALLPGHFLEWSPNARRLVRFWEPPPVDHGKSGDIIGEFRQKLDDAVRGRLRRTDGPVAAHLSSGLDSTGVAATAARLLPDRRDLIAFTMIPSPEMKLSVPPKYSADESQIAGEAARMVGVEQRLVWDSQPLLDCLRDHATKYQTPVPNVPNHGWGQRINEEASASGAKVLLSAAQGNATISFGSIALLSEYLATGQFGSYARQLRQFVRRQQMRWRNAIFWSLIDYIPAAITNPLFGAPPRSAASFFIKPEPARRVAGDKIGSSYRAPGVRRDQYDMLSHHGPGIFLKASLAVTGLDDRDAGSDQRLAEFCLSLPVQHYVNDGQARLLARRGFADRLPLSVTGNQVRGFQGTDWFAKLSRQSAREWIEEISASHFANEILDFSALTAAIDRWDTIAALAPGPLRDWGIRFTRALSVGAFLSELERDYDRLGRRT
jgi:asparagine synthase (glutamine-hydrolysing)